MAPNGFKWCIKSSSGYDTSRKLGFVSLPSLRLLYDYSHLIENGVGFQPKVVEMLYSD
ncbi:hypothetical protein DPMN_135431 [Dreissena polymorpha]|uniref:Uncharacterized protein n=1 Tax=Dreissena polymorpha TaxID=45954 RepID=A0A9D4FY42_DREPO|nr:hypothetical protein DPMN_135431 [Dreissena polymorpha]